jgi:hypothetical protein
MELTRITIAKTSPTNHLTQTASKPVFHINLAGYPNSQLCAKLVGKMLAAG